MAVLGHKFSPKIPIDFLVGSIILRYVPHVSLHDVSKTCFPIILAHKFDDPTRFPSFEPTKNAVKRSQPTGQENKKKPPER